MFLNIQKAFDTLNHYHLMYKLRQMGISDNIMCILPNSYEIITGFTVINGWKSKNIRIERRLRQGGCQSTLLFLVYLNDLLNELELSSFGACIYEIMLGHPAFADDLAILALFPQSTFFL